MTEITHEEIRELLPDLLHGGLDEGSRAVVEEHLRHCGECAEELRVLAMVKDAPTFAPAIDAVKIASRIQPYGRVIALPPVRSTSLSWQVAATLAAAVILVSIVVFRGATHTVSPVARPVVAAAPAKPQGNAVLPVPASPSEAVAPVVKNSPPARQVQLAEGLDGLSDESIAQLLRQMNDLEALPAAEPEPLGVGDGSSGTGTQGIL